MDGFINISGSGNQVHLDGASIASATITGSGSNIVWAGSGSDTIDASASTGGNLFITGSGSASIAGGSGNDQFEVTSITNSTIDGGSGSNVAYMDGLSTSDVTINTTAGVTTVTYGGNTMTFTNVQDLYFTDTDYKPT